ncbi:hypothetical protein DK389_08515 [Methylobacterium durans]|uniref:Uncharacterized protein n=1 Tax=Methylobacterium durans TaxID=2202825 RepID=A0A2U8W5K6_9HYPH|nr:hypothetical protein DK389_08515 [Methylobacterium durans]
MAGRCLIGGVEVACPDAPINSLVYVAASEIVGAIDGLAETVTSDRKHFHLTQPPTPGGSDLTGWLWTGLIARISQDRRSWR